MNITIKNKSQINNILDLFYANNITACIENKNLGIISIAMCDYSDAIDLLDKNKYSYNF